MASGRTNVLEYVHMLNSELLECIYGITVVKLASELSFGHFMSF